MRSKYAIMCAVLLALSLDASGSEPRLSQYAHSVWRTQDGLFTAAYGIAQSKDGYLWVGTDAGLLRFDGVRFVAWNTFPEESIANWEILSVLAASDGSVWIGASGRVAQIKGGHILRFSIPGRASRFLEDDKGHIWFTQTRVRDGSGPVCEVAQDHLTCYGTPEMPVRSPQALVASKNGGFWIGDSASLCEWVPGKSADCYLQDALKPLNGMAGVTGVLDAASGNLWVGIANAGPGHGLGKLVNGKWKMVVLPGLVGSTVAISCLFEDKAGAVWAGTLENGVYRIHGGRAEHVGLAEGLSSNTVNAIVEDREGVVWVSTTGGIDAFRRLPISAFSVREGLPSDAVNSVLPASDGSVWIGDNSLHLLTGDFISQVARPAQQRDGRVTAMLEDHGKRLWVGVGGTLNVLEHGIWKAITTPDGRQLGLIQSLAEDTAHDVWAVAIPAVSRIYRLRNLVVQEEYDAKLLGTPSALAADPASGVWFGYRNGAIALYRDGKLTNFAPDAIGKSAIRALMPDRDGTVFASSAEGVVALRNGTRQWLTTDQGLPCPAPNSILRDARQDIWLATSCGVVYIKDAQWQKWWAHREGKIAYRLFGLADGAHLGAGLFTPRAKAGIDGRLWFATGDVALMIDPSRLAAPTPPPAVRIEDVTADRVALPLQGALRLPTRTRDLEIRYTAMTLVNAQNVRFRYRLDGRDDTWRDAGTRREALYNDLRPGSYRFRVKASSVDGEWNDTDTSIAFEIPPAFFETRWFLALCAALGLSALYAVYVVRLRQIAARVRDRAAAKSAERERIARDLHDTLLQGTQGLIFEIQAAASGIPRSDPAREALEAALLRADDVLAEGRDRIQDLRIPVDRNADLATSLAAVGNELRAAAVLTFELGVEGGPKRLRAEVHDEAYRIGREALLNAFRHAQAKRVEVEIVYARKDFCLRVRDDGKGIDTTAFESGSRPGHWGLAGMRERAKKIHAQLDIWSKPAAGTEIELRIPAELAYEKRGSLLRRMWGQRFAGI